MSTSLPDDLQTFVQARVAEGGYSTTGECVRELICRDRNRFMLRGLLLEGASSPTDSHADRAYFRGLRQRIDASTR